MWRTLTPNPTIFLIYALHFEMLLHSLERVKFCRFHLSVACNNQLIQGCTKFHTFFNTQPKCPCRSCVWGDDLQELRNSFPLARWFIGHDWTLPTKSHGVHQNLNNYYFMTWIEMEGIGRNWNEFWSLGSQEACGMKVHNLLLIQEHQSY